MASNAFGIILLPPPELSAELVSYSHQVAALSNKVTVTLHGIQRPPHLTLLHFNSDEATARAMWTRLTLTTEPTLAIQLSGLMFSPTPIGSFYVPEGGIYFGLDAMNTSVLRAAHFRLLDLAEELDAMPISASRENFSPHITLGTLQRFPAGDVPLPAEIVLANTHGSIALGRLGPYGTFPEILATTAKQ